MAEEEVRGRDAVLHHGREHPRGVLHGDRCQNEAQHQEWVELFAIDEIKGDLTTPGYSQKLKPEFLKAHPTLVLDTRHFDVGFHSAPT